MPGPELFTPDEVIEALEATGGMVFLAARKLDCSQSTIYNYIQRYPSVKEAKEFYRGEMLDEAESGLRDAIRDREAWAIRFGLSTIGRVRGYIARQEQEISGRDGGPIEILDARQRVLADIEKKLAETEAPATEGTG